jgi:SAM-dependent methyltransferase
MTKTNNWPVSIIPSSPAEVWEASYPDFVGMINQTNVMPGSFTTLSKWATYSKINAQSRILEVACTTGYSIRELSLMSGCSGVGFDLSEKAIMAAEYNRLSQAPKANLRFTQADGYTFSTTEVFSHIVLGSSLGFFPDPARMMGKCLSMLEDGGYILATSFYVDGEMPEVALQKRREVFGITTPPENYKTSVKYYKGLDVFYEDRNDMYLETDDEITDYCQSTVSRISEIANIKSSDILQAFYDRLNLVKRTSNELRQFQKYAVLIYKYNAANYPRRYVELF